MKLEMKIIVKDSISGEIFDGNGSCEKEIKATQFREVLRAQGLEAAQNSSTYMELVGITLTFVEKLVESTCVEEIRIKKAYAYPPQIKAFRGFRDARGDRLNERAVYDDEKMKWWDWFYAFLELGEAGARAEVKEWWPEIR